MSMTTHTEPGISIPGTTSHFLEPIGSRDQGQGRLRYLTGGTGAPLVLLHTVRTQAEHFRHLIPLVAQHYTVYALDLWEHTLGVAAMGAGVLLLFDVCAPPAHDDEQRSVPASVWRGIGAGL